MTLQVGESIIIDGVKYTTASELFLPDDPLVVVPVSSGEAHQSSSLCTSTGCWRGYRGTWEIRGRYLYLVDLIGGWKLVKENAPAFAIWYSGRIRIPLSKILPVCHSIDSYDPIYEKELHIVVHKGVVRKKTEVDNRGKSMDELMPKIILF